MTKLLTFIIVVLIIVCISALLFRWNKATEEEHSGDAGYMCKAEKAEAPWLPQGRTGVVSTVSRQEFEPKEGYGFLEAFKFLPEFEHYDFSPVAKNYSEVKRLLTHCFSVRRAVIIDYETGSPQPFEPARKIRAVKIYAMGPNYFEAFCYYRGTTRTFRLDRVRGVMPTDRSYTIPARFVPGEWVRR